MRKQVTVDVQAQITNEVACNKCGKSVAGRSHSPIEHDESLNASSANTLPVHVANQFIPFDIEFGYGSKHDGDKWKFDLCESCVDELVASFVVPIYKE